MTQQYDSEELKIMKDLEDWMYKSVSPEELKKYKQKLRWAGVYSVDKDGNKTLILKWWKRVAKKSISPRLHEEDIQWIKRIALSDFYFFSSS